MSAHPPPPVKKAFLVGYNYPEFQCSLKGCWNDVDAVRAFLLDRGYAPEHITVIKDTLETPRIGPNVLMDKMLDFASSINAGEHAFFHFSGHGGQLPDLNGDEKDKKDECIFADDLSPIRDDDLRKVLVDTLPKDAVLVALLDCCHSGTGLDLPFSINRFGGREENRQHSPNKVFCISACDDRSTAADTSFNRIPQGALTHAFIEVFTRFRGLYWIQALSLLIERTAQFRQTTQLSSSLKDPRSVRVEL